WRPPRRHSPMRLLAPVLLALTMAACAAPTAAPEATKSAQPQRGGTLVFPGAQPPVTLHPFSGGVGANVNLSSMFEPLVRTKYTFTNGQLDDYRIDNPQEPWLAEKWDRPDDKTFVFTLRQGVKWQDGQPLTVDDITFSLQHFMEPKSVFPGGGALAALVDKVEKLDDRSLKIALKQPDADFLET